MIPPLTSEDIPAKAEALRDELGGLLPRVPIASVLVEIDARPAAFPWRCGQAVVDGLTGKLLTRPSCLCP